MKRLRSVSSDIARPTLAWPRLVEMMMMQLLECKSLQLTEEDRRHTCFLREINSIPIAISDCSLIEDGLYEQPEFHTTPFDARRKSGFNKDLE